MNYKKILTVLAIVSAALLLAGCTDSGSFLNYEGDPVAIDEVSAIPTNWDADVDDDGYEIWFTLVDANNELVSANGYIFYSIHEEDIWTETYTEVMRTDPIQVSASDFGEYVVGIGAFERTLLLHPGRFTTEYTSYDYTVFVHFVKEDGTELVGKDW